MSAILLNMNMKFANQQFGELCAKSLKIDEMFGTVAIRYCHKRTEKAVKHDMSLSGGFLVTYVTYPNLVPVHKLAKKFADYHSAYQYAETLRGKKGAKFNYYSLNTHPNFAKWLSDGAEGIPYSLDEYGKVVAVNHLDQYEGRMLGYMKNSTAYPDFDKLIGKVGYYNSKVIRGIETYHMPREVYAISNSGFVTATVKWSDTYNKKDQAKEVEFVKYETIIDMINSLFIGRIARTVIGKKSDECLPSGLYSDYHSMKKDGLIKVVGNSIFEICKFAKIRYSEHGDNFYFASS